MPYEKADLPVPEDLIERRLGFLRAEYDRKHAKLPVRAADA